MINLHAQILSLIFQSNSQHQLSTKNSKNKILKIALLKNSRLRIYTYPVTQTSIKNCRSLAQRPLWWRVFFGTTLDYVLSSEVTKRNAGHNLFFI